MSLTIRLIMTASVTLLMMVEVGAKPDVGKVFCYCGYADDPRSDFQVVVEDVTRDLIYQTPQQNYNYYYNEMKYLGITGYGHAICNYKLSHEDCLTCLNVANVNRIKLCGAVAGFQISLIDCYMRVEEFDFKWDPNEVSSVA